jgi:polynucleotide 5'-hydroxyl-kinase GRC3/NOL9
MIPEPDWEVVLKEAKECKKVIVIGSVDSGKSTFIKYLIKNLNLEKPLIFIDSDIGQSSIGIPTTIALKYYKKEEAIKFEEKSPLIDFDKIYFVGATTPSVCPQIFLDEIKKAAEFAEHLNTTTLIDTTGLISAEQGKQLKLRKIEIFKPDLVIAFNKNGEIDHIINEIKSKVITLKPSSRIIPRNSAQRASYRLSKFKKYFEKLESFALEKRLLKKQQITENLEGTILGIFNSEDCIALGILEEVTKENVIFSSPPIDLKNVTHLKIGFVNLKNTFLSD